MLEEVIKIECLKSIEEAFVGLLEFLQLDNLNLLVGYNTKYFSLSLNTITLFFVSLIILIFYKVLTKGLR